MILDLFNLIGEYQWSEINYIIQNWLHFILSLIIWIVCLQLFFSITNDFVFSQNSSILSRNFLRRIREHQWNSVFKLRQIRIHKRLAKRVNGASIRIMVEEVLKSFDFKVRHKEYLLNTGLKNMQHLLASMFFLEHVLD